MEARIASLYRYPVKGLSPEPLASAELKRGQYFPGDRLFAVENGPSGFAAEAPAHQPKFKFLMLMRDERLALLRTRYDEETHTLTIAEDGGETVCADLATSAGRRTVEAFLCRFMAKELRGPPKVLEAPDRFRFTDSRRGFVSIVNLASVAALAGVIGAPVNPLRLRANVYVAGWPAWHEFELIDRALVLGNARLKVTQRIVRCAATNVDPDSGVRDRAIPAALMQHYGHADCGVYAEIVADGTIQIGDAVGKADAAQP